MRSIIVTAILAGYAAASSLSKQHKHIRRTSTFQIVYNGTEKLKAANNNLYIGSPKQDACCNQFNAEDAATFYLQDEELFLYSPGNPKQQVIVNSAKAAKECQTSVGYVIGSRKKLDKTLREGWRMDDDDNITFKGLNLMVCSSSGFSTPALLLASIPIAFASPGSYGYGYGYGCDCEKVATVTATSTCTVTKSIHDPPAIETVKVTVPIYKAPATRTVTKVVTSVADPPTAKTVKVTATVYSPPVTKTVTKATTVTEPMYKAPITKTVTKAVTTYGWKPTVTKYHNEPAYTMYKTQTVTESITKPCADHGKPQYNIGVYDNSGYENSGSGDYYA
ncbi:hypothetical protein FVER53590_03682 [Fusarium verticillioides]|nr:hypothetical protein FVER53590_03682 [Fusarium verticillioides]